MEQTGDCISTVPGLVCNAPMMKSCCLSEYTAPDDEIVFCVWGVRTVFERKEKHRQRLNQDLHRSRWRDDRNDLHITKAPILSSRRGMMMSMATVTEERRWAFPRDVPVQLGLELDVFDGVLLFAVVDVAVESVDWIGSRGNEVVDRASVIFERVLC